MPTALLLASGGLDSTVLWWHLRDRGWEITPLFVAFGQPAQVQEEATLREVCTLAGAALGRVEIRGSLYEDYPMRALLPGRNLVLLSLAAAHAADRGLSCVVAGFNAEDTPRTDASLDFIRRVQALAHVTPPRVRLLAPLAKRTKADVVALGQRLGAPIALTVSCYAGVPGGCRRCRGCDDRSRAYERAGRESFETTLVPRGEPRRDEQET